MSNVVFMGCWMSFVDRVSSYGAVAGLFRLGAEDARLLSCGLVGLGVLLVSTIAEVAVILCPSGKFQEIAGLSLFGGSRHPVCPWISLAIHQRAITSVLSLACLHDLYLIWVGLRSDLLIRLNTHDIHLGDTVQFTGGDHEGLQGTVMAVNVDHDKYRVVPGDMIIGQQDCLPVKLHNDVGVGYLVLERIRAHAKQRKDNAQEAASQQLLQGVQITLPLQIGDAVTVIGGAFLGHSGRILTATQVDGKKGFMVQILWELKLRTEFISSSHLTTEIKKRILWINPLQTDMYIGMSIKDKNAIHLPLEKINTFAASGPNYSATKFPAGTVAARRVAGSSLSAFHWVTIHFQHDSMMLSKEIMKLINRWKKMTELTKTFYTLVGKGRVAPARSSLNANDLQEMAMMVEECQPAVEDGYGGRFGEVVCIGKRVSVILEADDNNGPQKHHIYEAFFWRKGQGQSSKERMLIESESSFVLTASFGKGHKMWKVLNPKCFEKNTFDVRIHEQKIQTFATPARLLIRSMEMKTEKVLNNMAIRLQGARAVGASLALAVIHACALIWSPLANRFHAIVLLLLKLSLFLSLASMSYAFARQTSIDLKVTGKLRSVFFFAFVDVTWVVASLSRFWTTAPAPSSFIIPLVIFCYSLVSHRAEINNKGQQGITIMSVLVLARGAMCLFDPCLVSTELTYITEREVLAHRIFLMVLSIVPLFLAFSFPHLMLLLVIAGVHTCSSAYIYSTVLKKKNTQSGWFCIFHTVNNMQIRALKLLTRCCTFNVPTLLRMKTGKSAVLPLPSTKGGKEVKRLFDNYYDRVPLDHKEHPLVRAFFECGEAALAHSQCKATLKRVLSKGIATLEDLPPLPKKPGRKKPKLQKAPIFFKKCVDVFKSCQLSDVVSDEEKKDQFSNFLSKLGLIMGKTTEQLEMEPEKPRVPPHVRVTSLHSHSTTDRRSTMLVGVLNGLKREPHDPAAEGDRTHHRVQYAISHSWQDNSSPGKIRQLLRFFHLHRVWKAAISHFVCWLAVGMLVFVCVTINTAIQTPVHHPCGSGPGPCFRSGVCVGEAPPPIPFSSHSTWDPVATTQCWSCHCLEGWECVQGCEAPYNGHTCKERGRIKFTDAEKLQVSSRPHPFHKISFETDKYSDLAMFLLVSICLICLVACGVLSVCCGETCTADLDGTEWHKTLYCFYVLPPLLLGLLLMSFLPTHESFETSVTKPVNSSTLNNNTTAFPVASPFSISSSPHSWQSINFSQIQQWESSAQNLLTFIIFAAIVILAILGDLLNTKKGFFRKWLILFSLSISSGVLLCFLPSTELHDTAFNTSMALPKPAQTCSEPSDASTGSIAISMDSGVVSTTGTSVLITGAVLLSALLSHVSWYIRTGWVFNWAKDVLFWAVSVDDSCGKDDVALCDHAGSLRNARRLIVFFSEAYAQNLFCVYECAAFCKIHRMHEDKAAESHLVVLGLYGAGGSKDRAATKARAHKMIREFTCRQTYCCNPHDRFLLLKAIREEWKTEELFDEFVRTTLAAILARAESHHANFGRRAVQKAVHQALQ